MQGAALIGHTKLMKELLERVQQKTARRSVDPKDRWASKKPQDKDGQDAPESERSVS